jgi:hypothetical protein
MEDKYAGKKFNDTFRGDVPTQYNACVGNNGSPSYREYADGFADAAIILIEKSLTTLNIDEQIYPICFNMRHSVELRLKHQISQLKLIRNEISLDDFDSAGSHDIGNIWTYFKAKSETVDKRFKRVIDAIDGYINDIAEIDPTGQTFRYPLSTDSVKHLVNVSIINVVRLRDRFLVLREGLEELHYLSDALIREYQQGTYTQRLSRVDVAEISKKLPVFNEWQDDAFKDIKEELKVDYGIGSKELSKAIDLIKNHYEFSLNIGLKVELKNSDFDDLNVFFNCLLRSHPLEGYLGGPRVVNMADIMDEILAELDADKNNDLDTIADCKNRIDIDALIEIFALYEFGRNLDYSEFFMSIYKNELSLKQSYENAEQEFTSAILHYVYKKNAYELIIKALKFLNQFEIVTELDKLFNLSEYFDFVVE